MDPPVVYYNPAHYIVTASGNKVCKQSVLCGSQNIVLLGKTIIQSNCVIRGDLAKVKIGTHCVISSKSVIRPPFKRYPKGCAFFAMEMGDHVYIGENSVINASVVGSFVHIGKNCVIGRHSVLKSCCAIADNTIVPPGTTVPCFSVVGGSPGLVVGELPECAEHVMIDFTKNYYANFIEMDQRMLQQQISQQSTQQQQHQQHA